MNETERIDEDDMECVDVVEELVTDEPGIVHIELDPREGRLQFDYDPAQISPPEIERVADRVAPVLQKRWETCTMLLDKQGGRACETCALALENRLRQVDGVRRATASFRGGALSVTYDTAVLSPDQLVREVSQLGAPVRPAERPEPAAPAVGWRRWGGLIRERLEPIFLIATLVTMVGGWAAERNEAALAATVLFTIAYVTGGYFGLRAGLESLRARTIDVDLLMILAAVGAAVVGQPFEGVMLLFLFSLSNVLQDYAMERTRNAISSLMELRPDAATVRRGERLVTLPIERVQVGDRIVVKPGERIALDGVVVEGESSVDQASITGESIPVGKRQGDTVFAGTINKNGHLEIGVTKLAQDTTLARLIKMVEEAHSEKAQTQRFIDTAEQYYAIGVIVFTLLVMAVPPLLFGQPFWNPAPEETGWFYRAMTVLVAASPCALVISTPATVLSAIGNGARRGVLFKGGIHVENAASIKVVTFDKTGTLTEGKPQVTDVVPLNGSDADTLLALAAAVEAKSEHPLAQAIVQAARDAGLELLPATSFNSKTGLGVSADVNGRKIAIGNRRYFQASHAAGAVDGAADVIVALQDAGKTSVAVVAFDDDVTTLLGVIAIADVLRPDAAANVAAIKAAGVERVVMLTGDNERVARAIAAEAGVDDFYAGLMPEDKVRIVKELQAQYGPVSMVGDGVNDAPALATATLGIAMGAAGTDVAMESADLVLMSDDLSNIPYVFALSRKTRRTLLANLGFSLFMIFLMIGAIFTIELPLPLAVLGHEGGTVLVSLNGLRLLAYRYNG